MIPVNTANGTKMFIDNYFALGKDGVETPEIISDLVMKNGYVIYFLNAFIDEY